jgi:hypothetical protein
MLVVTVTDEAEVEYRFDNMRPTRTYTALLAAVHYSRVAVSV